LTLKAGSFINLREKEERGGREEGERVRKKIFDPVAEFFSQI
jgi:hypothetical protein